MELGDRVSLMEQALTRLTTIQEQQTHQTEKIINSMDNFTKISVTVEQNAKDIDELHAAVNVLNDRHDSTTTNTVAIKEYCMDLSFRRLKLAIGVSVGVVTALFGYLYLDVVHNVNVCNTLEKKIIRLDMHQEELLHGKLGR